MTQFEKDLIFTIMSDKHSILPIIYQMKVICEIGRALDFNQVLMWLSKERLVGDVFLDWFKEKNDNSVLNAVAFVRQKLQNDLEKKKIYSKRN